MADVIFPASLALRALRSTSYRNTAHAVAELIDNSFDAEASQIGVVLLADEPNGEPHTVAVLDNGRGMGEETLRKSIQYGFSGQDSALDKPLGKFGVGLVAASFSQCSDLTIMSWQHGEAASGRALATGIRIVEGDIDNNLPDPSYEPIPDWTDRAFEGMPTPIADMTSGSLVLWRNVQPSWKRSETLRHNLADLCGRIYRNFIADGKLTISVNVFDSMQETTVRSTTVPAVDPMFLSNWDDNDLSRFGFVDDNTLFDPYTGVPADSGRNQAGDYEPEMLEVKGPEGELVGCCLLTASYRSPRVLSDELSRVNSDPGATPYGRLAKRLEGVSILRSQREIDLDPAWLRLSRTVDRWVSVSLDFDPDLDEIFGVSNDKQKAHRLSETASLPRDEIRKRITALEEEPDRDDRMLMCLKVALNIKTKLSEMQAIIHTQRTGVRSGTNGADAESTRDPSHAPLPELVSNGATMADGGTRVPQDDARPRDHRDETTQAYEGSLSDGMPASEVRPPIVIENNLKVDIVADHQDITAKMFRVTLPPAHMVVHLNARHPLYGALSRLLLTDTDRDPDEPEPSIQDALQAVRGLLVSYARANVEVAYHNPAQAAEFERCALKWGEVAERLFRDPDR